MSAADKLRQMITAVPEQSEAIGNSIGQVEDQIDELTEEIDAIEDGVCAVAETDAIDILENTVAVDKGGYVWYGPDFGIIQWSPPGNLTDWEIRDSTSHAPIYTYSQGDYPDLDTDVDDYEFGNDYLTRPLTDGASYGLKPSKTNLQYAQSILEENQDKIEDSATVFDKYATGGS